VVEDGSVRVVRIDTGAVIVSVPLREATRRCVFWDPGALVAVAVEGRASAVDIAGGRHTQLFAPAVDITVQAMAAADDRSWIALTTWTAAFESSPHLGVGVAS
jgi:hypothetical protein